jgi:TRAP-type C4-dicarboxylate transport system permease small subunit
VILPWPVLIVLFFGGAVIWAGWVMFRDREWRYADESLLGRALYFVLFALVFGGVAVWLILRGPAASN